MLLISNSGPARVYVDKATKIGKHTRAPASTFPNPDGRFTHLHVDLVGPLERVDGYKYILSIVDRFTRWPVAIPLASITAESFANAIGFPSSGALR